MEDEYLIVPSGSPESYCRLCLSETNIEVLLVSGPYAQPNQKLVDLIRRHIEIGLSAPTDSPCGICSTCRMMLEEFERFRERCLRCDYVLTGIDRQNGLVLPFECSQCPSKFRFKSEFEKHWKSFHDLHYRCHVCNAAFSTQSMLICHTKLHDENSSCEKDTELYDCSYCPRIYSNDKQLKLHVQLLHETRHSIENVLLPRKRKQNNLKSTEAPPNKVALNVNPQADVNSSDKPYECQSCKIRFHFIGSLTRHINDKHSSRRKTPTTHKGSQITPVAPFLIEEPMTVTAPNPELTMVSISNMAIASSEPTSMVSMPPSNIPMINDQHIDLTLHDSDVPMVDDQDIEITSAAVTSGFYNPSFISNNSEFITGDITSEIETADFKNFNPQQQTSMFSPFLIELKRLDEKLIPPIKNSEIPLGKYYHALQMQSTAVEDPIDADFMKNYPSFARDFNKSFECEICNTMLKSKVALHRHKLYKHNPGIFFPCLYCGKNFQGKTGLDRHLPLHTNEFPHVCDECPLGFTRVGLLKKHKEKYHGPDALPLKLHYCPYCSRAFNKLHLIKNHVAFQHQDQYIPDD